MKIVGIDPGLASTGIGIVQGNKKILQTYSFCTITTSKELILSKRLNFIYSEVYSIIEKENPDLIVIEEVFSLQKYPKSAITLGQVSGVIQLTGSMFDIPMIEIPVREAKQVLTGNGNANKVQLEKSVRNHLNRTDPVKPFHASDALALALIGFFRFNSRCRLQDKDFGKSA